MITVVLLALVGTVIVQGVQINHLETFKTEQLELNKDLEAVMFHCDCESGGDEDGEEALDNGVQ